MSAARISNQTGSLLHVRWENADIHFLPPHWRSFVLMRVLISRYRVRGGGRVRRTDRSTAIGRSSCSFNERGCRSVVAVGAKGSFLPPTSIPQSPKGTLLLPGLPSTILADDVWTAKEGKERRRERGGGRAFQVGGILVRRDGKTHRLAGWLSMASLAWSSCACVRGFPRKGQVFLGRADNYYSLAQHCD